MAHTKLASKKLINEMAEALRRKGVSIHIVQNTKEALDLIKKLIPKNATVTNGSSQTLHEIGYLDYLNSKKHPWVNLHDQISKENDKQKRALLRKQSSISDYYLGSVHALTKDGVYIVASNTGSQLPSIAFNSLNLIFIVGAQKIVPTLAEGLNRLKSYVFKKEDEHMRKLYGEGTQLSKILIINQESPKSTRTTTIILVNQNLGY